MKKKKKIIIFTAILIIIFASIIIYLYYFSKNKYKYKENKFIDTNKNEIIFPNYSNLNDFNDDKNLVNPQKNNNNTTKDKVTLDPPDTDPWGENLPIKEEDLIFEKKTDEYSYFATKQCLTKFYSSKENVYNAIENKVKQFDVSNYYNNEKEFIIDEIYEAPVKSSKDIYFLYYRIGKEINNSVNKQAMIKIDEKNASFYVYPFEYLQSINYLNLKEGSKLSLDVADLSEIQKTEYNLFNKRKVERDESTCIKELLERLKFDINYDLNHLYNILDEEYKEVRFRNSFQTFTTIMNRKKEIYLSNIIEGYQKYDLNWYTQYILIFPNDINYVVNMVDIMNYSLQFDYYTTVIPAYSELYNSNLPHIRAKYCIDRVRQAIDDENYEFIYAKLNPVQKSNYYKNFDDFANFIKTYFYKKNKFEYGKYTKISDTVYKYIVEVKDEINENSATMKFNMTINFRENDDFTISITL